MTTRTYGDRCPGVLRPWPADDGALVRLRIPGGRISGTSLLRLVDAAERHGDGTVFLTKRANLQLRGLPAPGGALPERLVAEFVAAGVLPSRTHELVRNIVASPLTGMLGGRVDLRPTVFALDELLQTEPQLAGLGGRFLIVLDDGRGDVAGRELDLGAVAVDGERMQVRAGARCWGPVVPVDTVPAVLAEAASRFQRLRGSGPQACWHVDELPQGGRSVVGGDRPRDPATVVESEPPRPGTRRSDDGRKIDVIDVPDGMVRRPLAERLAATAELVVTPWRSIVTVTG